MTSCPQSCTLLGVTVYKSVVPRTLLILTLMMPAVLPLTQEMSSMPPNLDVNFAPQWASDVMQFESTPQLSRSNQHLPGISLGLVVHNSLCDVLRLSSILQRDCDGARLDDNDYVPLLVTTTGRSGTDYLHALLKSLGLVTMHDNADGTVMNAKGERSWPNHTDVVVSWPLAFANNAVPGCHHPNFGGLQESRRFRHVAHLLREPLSSINSRYNMGSTDAFKSASNCFTTAGTGSKLAQTLKHYVLWNSFIEASSRFHLPLEQINAAWLRALLAFSGLPVQLSDTKMDSKIESMKQAHVNSKHTHKGPALSWKVMRGVDSEFAVLAQLLALRHGYEIHADYLLFSSNASSVPQQHCGLKRTQNFSDVFGRWNCWLVWVQNRRAFPAAVAPRAVPAAVAPLAVPAADAVPTAVAPRAVPAAVAPRAVPAAP